MKDNALDSLCGRFFETSLRDFNRHGLSPEAAMAVRVAKRLVISCFTPLPRHTA